MEESEWFDARSRLSRSLKDLIKDCHFSTMGLSTEMSTSITSLSDSVEQLPSESQLFQRLPIISLFLVMNFSTTFSDQVFQCCTNLLFQIFLAKIQFSQRSTKNESVRLLQRIVSTNGSVIEEWWKERVVKRQGGETAESDNFPVSTELSGKYRVPYSGFVIASSRQSWILAISKFLSLNFDLHLAPRNLLSSPNNSTLFHSWIPKRT